MGVVGHKHKRQTDHSLREPTSQYPNKTKMEDNHKNEIKKAPFRDILITEIQLLRSCDIKKTLQLRYLRFKHL